MVAKISVGSSLYGAIAYNGEKINEAQGRLLTTNRIYNDGSGIRFGKYPKKRISGYLNVPFIISSNRSFLESCCK